MRKCIYCAFGHFLMCGASPGTAASKAERAKSQGDEEGWEGQLLSQSSEDVHSHPARSLVVHGSWG